LNRIDKVQIRRLDTKDRVSPNNFTIIDLPTIGNEYERNNNESISYLKNVKFDNFSRTETLLFATSGSTMGLILLIAVSILIWRCSRMCRASRLIYHNENCPTFENECKQRNKSIHDKSESEENSLENADLLTEQNVEKDKSMLECETKRPAFQQRRVR